jgi:uncharacterized protein YrrD
MLKLSNSMIDVPVVSLRTGSVVGNATRIIINPNNLKIEGWHVVDKFDNRDLILVANEAREVLESGIAINDHENLSPAGELIRLKNILEINFELIGKVVTTESGKRLGKVSDFAIDTESLIIKKVYASQSLIKNFTGGTLNIDRSQIVEITDKRIIVDDLMAKAEATAPAPA